MMLPLMVAIMSVSLLEVQVTAESSLASSSRHHHRGVQFRRSADQHPIVEVDFLFGHTGTLWMAQNDSLE
jgi:hypothetical protein